MDDERAAFRIPVPEPRIGQEITPMEGLRVWRNPMNGFMVARVHYTADPNRRGEWRYKHSPAFGGLRSWRWRKEQEIDWEAMSGRLVFENWDELVHSPDPFEIPWHWPRWVLIDPGWVNPCSVLWVAVDTDSEPNQFGHLPIHVYREFYQSKTSSRHVARIVHDSSFHVKQDGVRDQERLEEIIVDPGALQEHQSAAAPTKTDESSETVFDQMQGQLEELGFGVPMSTGNNHKNASIEELVVRLGNYWTRIDGVPLYDDEDNYRQPTDQEILDGAYHVQPTIFIHASCPATVREIRMYRWREWASADVRDRNNDPESPVDKHDHSVTNLIRFVNELRRLRRQEDGEIAEDLSDFRSRLEIVKVATSEELAQDYHRRAAARYRKKVARGAAG